jgi:hypothetical protein
MKRQEQEEVERIVSGVATAHLGPLGITFNVLCLRAGAYVLSLSKDNKTFLDEGLCFDGVPEESWQDYVHCRAHELVARYMRKIWPVLV